MREWLDGITWFRGSSVRVRGMGSEVHVDPSGVTEESEADIILLTHPHFDNFSEADIARVRGPETVVVAPLTMKKQLADADHFMRPGDLLQLDGFDVLAVPAHNLEKKFHTPDDGWLGYVFTVDGTTFYHAGDTDFLPSMSGIRCDIAFLPCDGHYTMNVEDAAKAAQACGAEVVVPVHWGEPHGARADVERLEALFPGEVWVLEREGSRREPEGTS
ncbi:MAG: MBL fold metallo-hydrolase [Thioalkalivibrio sp.]|nr:MBL fold metallo-hydrolase [Thioalkalivibrio sp.]